MQFVDDILGEYALFSSNMLFFVEYALFGVDYEK